jgi:tRNA threonylcarbamoyl adenosine modification protein (Sua5/YciO/YrdC/YwlC family)
VPPPERIRLEPGPAWEAAVARAAAVLNGGGAAVLPAEGVYGYHVRADRAEARARLTALKPREAGRGFILLLADPAEAARWAPDPPARARELIRAYWPGALTLVLSAAPDLPEGLGAADGTVALRCPGSPFLRAVARAVGAALLSTSANAPGSPAPSWPSDIPPGGVDLIVDGGALSGVPSTLVLVAGEEVRILRAGAVEIAPGRP